MKSVSENEPSSIMKSLGSVLPKRAHIGVWCIIAVGVLLRTIQYLANRTLWVDECFATLYFWKLAPRELLHPLQPDQVAPIGFCLIQRILCDHFGYSEYILRLFPLFCGTVSLVLFYLLAKRLLTYHGTVVAVAMFSVLDALVYYSSEARQYSSDVTAVLACFLMAVSIRNSSRSFWFYLVMSIAAFFLILISYPSIFVLSSIAICFAYSSFQGAQRERFSLASIIGIGWLVALLNFAFYMPSMNSVTDTKLYYEYHSEVAELQGQPISLLGGKWFVKTCIHMFLLLRVPWVLLPALLFLFGFVSFWRNQREWLVILTLPLLIALVAATYGLYPMVGGTALFAVPSLVIIIAAGIQGIGLKAPVLATALFVALLWQPAVDSIGYMFNPRYRSEVRRIIEYVQSHPSDAKIIYLNWSARTPLQYYSKLHNYEPMRQMTSGFITNTRTLQDALEKYARKLEASREQFRALGKVWVIMSLVVDRDQAGTMEWGYFPTEERRKEETTLREFLYKNAKILDCIKDRFAAAYLCDFGAAEESAPD
jgi:hypothetical protein